MCDHVFREIQSGRGNAGTCECSALGSGARGDVEHGAQIQLTTELNNLRPERGNQRIDEEPIRANGQASVAIGRVHAHRIDGILSPSRCTIFVCRGQPDIRLRMPREIAYHVCSVVYVLTRSMAS